MEESAGKKSPTEEKELKEKLSKAQQEIERLKKENDTLKSEVEKLKQELSSKAKPKWVKPNLNKGKKKGKKKLGPKVGHKVNPRKPVDKEPDRELVWIPESCSKGHGNLPFPTKWHEHTQIDIPVHHETIVTLHKVGWSYCSCCGKYVAAKDEKLSYSKYGPNLHAYVVYLKLRLGMTYGKIQELLMEQYQLKISTGVLSEIVQRCGKKMNGDYEKLLQGLKNQTYLHADETGWRNGGNNEWLWSFSNDKVSVYTIVPSRGQKVVQAILGDSYNGILISDFYAAYNKIYCDKQKCWTHLLRDLHVLREKVPKDEEVKYFKMRMKILFERACNLKEEHLLGIDVDSKIHRLETDTIILMSKKFQNKKLQTLIKRMTKYYCELYTFIKKDIPPTNNPAEREIRPAVLMRKTSYCNRSEQGKKNQAILMSLINTCRKNNTNFMNYAANKLSNTGI